MRTNLIAYLSTVIVFLGIDFIWLTLTVNMVYKPRLGGLLMDKPNLPVALAFYLVYVIGIVVFAVMPAIEQGNWTRALWGGALFGFMAYATYDLTNLATLAGWSTTVSIIDMIWGTVLTGIAATAGYFITRMV